MSSADFVRQGERLDDLQNHGLMILQKVKGYRFGMDAVLLAHFARIPRGGQIADLGTGSGVLPLLMSQREPTARFFAFENQPELADMARRSVALNGLQDRIDVRCGDLRNAPDTLGPGSLDGIACNPPYGRRDTADASIRDARRQACHETDCSLRELAETCDTLLKNRGRLWLCFPAARMPELTDALRACRLEPKRARMVCARADIPPYLFLMEAVKNAKPSLLWLPTLTVCREDGTETEEIRRIYDPCAEEQIAKTV